MADNPKLTIELLDRSGNMGQASPSPNQPGASNVPGSTIASDFQQKVTEQGLGGQGQAQPSPTPLPNHVNDALENQTRATGVPTTPTSGYTGPQSGNPSLANAVRGLYEADPRITTDEIRGVLGVSREEANNLLNAARNTQRNDTPTPPIPTTPAPSLISPMPSSGSRTPSRGLDEFGGALPEPSPTSTGNDPYGGLTPTRYSPLSGRDVDPVTGRPYDYAPPRPSRPDSGYESEGYGTPRQSGVPTRPSTQDTAYTDPATGIVDRMQQSLDTVMDAEVIEAPRVSGRMVESVIQNAAGLVGSGGMANRVIGLAETAAPGIMGSIASSSIGTAIAGAALPVLAAGAVVAGGYAAYSMLDSEAQRAVAIASRYSPDAIQAGAEAEVRQIMADIRTSRRLGDEAADYTRSMSVLSDSSQNLRDIAVEPLLQRFNDALDVFAGASNGLNRIVTDSPFWTKFTQNLVGDFADKAATGFMPGMDWQVKLARELKKWVLPNEDNNVNLHDWLETTLPHLPVPPPFDHSTNEQPLGAKFAPIPGLNI